MSKIEIILPPPRDAYATIASSEYTHGFKTYAEYNYLRNVWRQP